MTDLADWDLSDCGRWVDQQLIELAQTMSIDDTKAALAYEAGFEEAAKRLWPKMFNIDARLSELEADEGVRAGFVLRLVEFLDRHGGLGDLNDQDRWLIDQLKRRAGPHDGG